MSVSPRPVVYFPKHHPRYPKSSTSKYNVPMV